MVFEEEMTDELGYVIAQSSKKYLGFCYLVDRNRFPKKWWTSKLSEALSFNTEEGALKVCNNLKFGDAQVYNRKEFHK